MRILRLLGVGALLAVAACGSDDSDDTADMNTPAAAETTAPEAPAETEAPAAPSAVIPEVVCSTGGFGEPTDIAFAYTNDSDTATVVDDGASVAVDSDPAGHFLVPLVFAPGRVSPALWLSSGGEGGAEVLPSWSVTGPDGLTRTATPDADTPECTRELLEPTTADPRTPGVEVESITPSVDGGDITVRLAVTGVESSVCPQGLTAEPVSISWSGDDLEGEGPTWDRDVTAGTDDTPTYIRAQVTVLDQCSSDGHVQVLWPGGELFENLYIGTSFCIVERNGEFVAIDGGDDGCPVVTPTGGVRIRPG